MRTNGSGRKKLAAKSHVVSFRVTRKQLAELRGAADRECLDVNAYCRSRALMAAARRRARVAPEEVL